MWTAGTAWNTGRRGCRSLTCLYLSERLEAGVVTMEELIAETVRPWKYLPLKQRVMEVIAQQAYQAPVRNLILHGPSMGPLQNRACQAKGFHFDGQLHIMRMLEMMGAKRSTSTAAGWRRYICSPPVRPSGRRPSPQSGRIRSILQVSGLVTARFRSTSSTGRQRVYVPVCWVLHRGNWPTRSWSVMTPCG